MKLGGRSKRAALAELDWIGILFLGLTIILILVPVSLGGAQLAWHSAGIIALFSTGGAMLLALLVWEAKFAKNPFLAPELFAGKTRTFTTVLFIDFVAGMGLYASMIFWVSLVSAECSVQI